jgi:hypothetical protein
MMVVVRQRAPLSARRSIHASAAAIYRPMGVKSISNFNR